MEFLKKNGFWIGSFLIAAAMIGTWFYATGGLQKLMDDRVRTIKGAIAKNDGVLRVQAEEGINVHPNAQTAEGMQEKLDQLSEAVLAAWQRRYDSQQEIMQWPNDALPADFIREFNKYHPPELLPLEEKGESERMKNLLLLYKEQIPNQMDDICSVIQTTWLRKSELDEEAVATSAAGSDTKTDDGSDTKSDDGDDAKTDDDGSDTKTEGSDSKGSGNKNQNDAREIVRWSENNQELWFEKLTQFLGRDDNQFTTKQPSPSQVYMLQQDLWLLEAMFEIIRDVNSDVDEAGNKKMVMANDLAPVKQIDHVVFGREALAALGDIEETAAAEQTSTAVRSAPRRSASGAQASDLNLAYYGKPAYHGRYVNQTFEPIEAEKIQTVLNAKTLPAADLELVVAKRVPVRLAVQMDERKITKFLAACANSPFAFEVLQVRINRHDVEEKIKLRGSEGAESASNRGPRGGGAGFSSGGGGGFDGDGFGGASGFGGSTGGGEARRKAPEIERRSDYEVRVEFYGVVKIYNPPNEALLNDGKTAETEQGSSL